MKSSLQAAALLSVLLLCSCTKDDKKASSQADEMNRVSLSTPAAVRSPRDDSHARRVRISVRDGDAFIGENPMFATAYDQEGKPAADISADYTNTIIDMQAISKTGHCLIGVQIGPDRRSVVHVEVRGGDQREAFINDNCIAYAGTESSVESGGPFVGLAFRDDSGPVDVTGCEATVSTAAGAILSSEWADSGVLVIHNVAREPMTVALRQRGTGRRGTATIYPAYVGASRTSVLYTVHQFAFR